MKDRNIYMVLASQIASVDMAILENNDDVEMKKIKIGEGKTLTRAEKRRIENNTTTLASALSKPDPKIGKRAYMEKIDRTGFISKFQRSNKKHK